ncbi:cupin domain-containing protein [Limnobaculum parvum]|uniref:Cupin domain-containing protein n=1 Tax=Limnobaculum parvum TaxID=2172103 RepID=A0A2Y9U1M8_9GAMM|nr:cupin domain-containing protein [Limnobaculum parvum]AWH89877.1 cupin domain-containing protein [Limnobaculum parvum]
MGVLTSLAPGMRCFPFHNYHVNEEVFIVIEGCGEVRIGENIYSIKSDDVIACTAGGQNTVHQIINNSEHELRYLALSTQIATDAVEYPDSGKYSVMAEFGVDDKGNVQGFQSIARLNDSVDYWQGE